jgi:hypothetical protein
MDNISDKISLTPYINKSFLDLVFMQYFYAIDTKLYPIEKEIVSSPTTNWIFNVNSA